MPVVKCHRDDEHECVDIDIVIGNMGGVRKSLFMRTVWAVDRRVAELVYLVKHWARICGLQRTPSRTFNSWALCLMCIHYLQRTEPPILPCLQDLCDATEAGAGTTEKFSSSAKLNATDTLGLLIGFIEHWQRFPYAECAIATLKIECPARRIDASKVGIEIIDPFDQAANPARSLHADVFETFTQGLSCLRDSLIPCPEPSELPPVVKPAATAALQQPLTWQQRGASEIPEEHHTSARAKEHWHELTPRELTAAKRLGWSAESWDEGTAPSCGADGWDSLSAEEQAAAADLGYDRSSWHADFVETPASLAVDSDGLESLPLKDLQIKCIEEGVDDAAFARALNSPQQSAELCELLRWHRASKFN